MATGAELDEFEATLLKRLRDVYGGMSWIMAGGVAQGRDANVKLALDLGATKAIGIATRMGVGELADDVRVVISNDAHVGDDASMVERIHDNNRELHDLPDWVIAEVDEWDPDHLAQVIVEFTFEGGVIAGRPTYGARRPEWAALEDKVAIRELWTQAGIATAPDQVLDTTNPAALVAAHNELATRWGTVWAVDNEQGWHGGGHGTHWVASVDEAKRLAPTLAADHRHVRVQPFLEGVPCSIHGMVLADSTLAFRPCEMLVLLDPDKFDFVYAGSNTFWDPRPADRASMRATAQAVGDQLRTMVDYRGVFTLDGVLTDKGFFPTEVNPRFGAALPAVLPTANGGELPVFFAHLAAVAGHLDDFDARVLEELFVDRLDRHSRGRAITMTAAGPTGQEQQVAIAGTWSGDRFVDLVALHHDDASASEPFVRVVWGTSPGGGLVFATFTEAMRSGPPVAPTLVLVRQFLNDHWRLDLPQLRSSFEE